MGFVDVWGEGLFDVRSLLISFERMNGVSGVVVDGDVWFEVAWEGGSWVLGIRF